MALYPCPKGKKDVEIDLRISLRLDESFDIERLYDVFTNTLIRDQIRYALTIDGVTDEVLNIEVTDSILVRNGKELPR